MRVRGRRLVAALVSLGLPHPALAATAVQPIAVPSASAQTAPVAGAPNGCVLHVWPGADAKSSYAGWFHGGAVNGDKRGIKGYPDMHATALGTGVQR